MADIFDGFDIAFVDSLIKVMKKPPTRAKINYVAPPTNYFTKAFKSCDVGFSQANRTSFAIGQKDRAIIFHIQTSTLTLENIPALDATKLKRYGYGEATGTYELYLRAPCYFIYAVPGVSAGGYIAIHAFYVNDTDTHYKPLFGEPLTIGSEAAKPPESMSATDLKLLVGKILGAKDLINKLAEIKTLDDIKCKCRVLRTETPNIALTSSKTHPLEVKKESEPGVNEEANDVDDGSYEGVVTPEKPQNA